MPGRRPGKATAGPQIEGGKPLNRAMSQLGPGGLAPRTCSDRPRHLQLPRAYQHQNISAPMNGYKSHKILFWNSFLCQRNKANSSSHRCRVCSPRTKLFLLTSDQTFDQTFSHRHLFAAFLSSRVFALPLSSLPFHTLLPKSWPAASPFPLVAVEPPMCVSDRLLLV